MPIVFVHGVANRASPEQSAAIAQRNELFKRLLLPGARVFDPDWGSQAVKFSDPPVWLPERGGATALGIDLGASPFGAEFGLNRIARNKPDLAVDLAFQAALADRLGRSHGQPATLTDQELAQFEAAVRYLDAGADRHAFDPNNSDAGFYDALAREIGPHLPRPRDATDAAQPFSIVGDALQWIKDGVSNALSGIGNATSDAALRLIRIPLSRQVALFLGDIFVYLRWREVQGPDGAAQRIFPPITTALASALQLRKPGDPLIVIGHSLGGVLLYDILTSSEIVEQIEQDAGQALVIDAWVTVGSQPGMFADMGLYGSLPPGAALRPKPLPVQHWLNVYDYTDVLSFSCARIFADVEDFEFDNVASVIGAHSAYFLRPSFYSRLRRRLKERDLIA